MQELTAARAYEILKRISEEDCRAMGFNTKYVRPDWMILTVLPVPPPPVRPAVMMDSSARCVAAGHMGIGKGACVICVICGWTADSCFLHVHHSWHRLCLSSHCEQ